MFTGFEKLEIETSGAVINAVRAGKGPPLLLLHGYPQTLAMWHQVAPRLAEHFTVVAADLRGYGASSKPEGGADHAGYSKRAMAQDQVELMQRLGFEQFFLAGHDRGGRVGHRMALDHPRRVKKPAVIHASCEDYRAAAIIDLEHDEADIASKVQCPLLVLWGAKGRIAQMFDVLETWRERASEVRGRGLPCGHYLPEEAPEETLDELLAFFRG